MAAENPIKEQARKSVSTSEHIRIAPLYFPKPKVSLEELGQDKEESELFDGKTHKAPASIIPKWDKNTLYFVYTGSGVSVHMGGSIMYFVLRLSQ